MPAQIVKGSFRYTESDARRYGTVKASWQDRDGAKLREVEVAGDASATATYVLREPYGSEAEAQAAAAAFARESTRENEVVGCALEGRPGLAAGHPVRFAGLRDGIDGRTFILDSVVHSYAKGEGLQTTITGKARAAE